MKRVVIAGGTGSLGSSLAASLSEHYNVVVLTRGLARQANPNLRYVEWDGENAGPWTRYIEGSFMVINFCGKPVDCRYTAFNKRQLVTSRVNPTLLIGSAISKAKEPPALWINASSSAYYGFSDRAMDETNPAGNDFPASICVAWEKAFFSVSTPSTRKVALRLGIVLQRGRGFILPFEKLVKTYFGGKIGSGKQYFTWIHEEDFVRSIRWISEEEKIQGVVNVTSPEPVSNKSFMLTLRKVLQYPVGIPIPSWMIAIGGKIIGIEPYLILQGRRILPGKLLSSGFTFRFPQLEEGLDELYNRKPEVHFATKAPRHEEAGSF